MRRVVDVRVPTRGVADHAPVLTRTVARVVVTGAVITGVVITVAVITDAITTTGTVVSDRVNDRATAQYVP